MNTFEKNVLGNLDKIMQKLGLSDSAEYVNKFPALSSFENQLVHKLELMSEGLDVQADWNETDNNSPQFILNKPSIAGQVQSDWNEADTESPAYIKNKPIIGGGPLVIEGTYESESGFLPNDGEPSKEEAIAAFLAGRSVILKYENAEELWYDMVLCCNGNTLLQASNAEWD